MAFGKKKKKASGGESYSGGYDPYQSYGSSDGTQDPYGSQVGDPYSTGGYDPYNSGTSDTNGYDDIPGSNNTSSQPSGRKKSHSIPVFIPILIVIAVIVAAYFGSMAVIGPGRAACARTVATAQKAINDLDGEAFCDVIDPSVGGKLKAVIKLTGISAGDSGMSDVLEQGLENMGIDLDDSVEADDEDTTGFLESLELKPYRYSFPGVSRTVYCNVESDGDRLLRIKMQMKKKSGKVYISKLSIAN